MTPEALGPGRFSDVPRANRHPLRVHTQAALLIRVGIHYTCVLKREHIAHACALRLKMQRLFTFGANRRLPARAADW